MSTPEQKFAKMLSGHEGRRRFVYKDSLGYDTCGVGFLIDKRNSDGIPEAVIDFWLDHAIQHHKQLLDKALPWAPTMGEARYYALLDMTYNLGIEPFDGDGFKDWPIFVGQLKTRQYGAAAENMRKTKWATQVGLRAMRLANMIATNEWPKDV